MISWLAIWNWIHELFLSFMEFLRFASDNKFLRGVLIIIVVLLILEKLKKLIFKH